MSKKILFVINTLGCGGAEVALLELLARLNDQNLKIFLYVITGQGELVKKLPSHIKLLNPKFNSNSVLSLKGRWNLAKTVIRSFLRNGHFFKKFQNIGNNLSSFKKKNEIQVDKVLWRMLSDGGDLFEERFDLAVAWLEGGSTYYVADHVNASKKCAFIHIDYDRAGYTYAMDQGCWNHFDRIFTVSQEAKRRFLKMYPQYEKRVDVFYNLINQDIIQRAAQTGGFNDNYEGWRLLTVGRLTHQKAIDIAIDSMKLLKDRGHLARWYVLGEGDQRKNLEKKIASLGLEKNFFLLGTVKNPYPYYRQADVYVQPSRFEGKSLAIQEAQILGCPIIASNCQSNQELIENNVDGILCELTPQDIANKIELLLLNQKKREELKKAAQEKTAVHEELVHILLSFL